MTSASGVSVLPPGTTAVVPGLPPLALDAVIPARHSLGCPYVTRGLGVVDRTLGACPVTCSPRHLTSHLSHIYKHSFSSITLAFSLLCVSRSVRLRAWVLRQRDSLRLVAIRVGLGPRLTPDLRDSCLAEEDRVVDGRPGALSTFDNQYFEKKFFTLPSLLKLIGKRLNAFSTYPAARLR